MKKNSLFNGESARILSAFMNGVIPRGGAFEKGALDDNLIPLIEDAILSYNYLLYKLIPFGIRIFKYWSLFSKGKLLTNLSDEEASDYITGLLESRIYYLRMFTVILKMNTLIAFFHSEENGLLIGYSLECTHLAELKINE